MAVLLSSVDGDLLTPMTLTPTLDNRLATKHVEYKHIIGSWNLDETKL